MNTPAPSHQLRSHSFPKTLAAFACPCILILLALLLFGSSGRDDAYISYWPAHTLLEHGEMVNYSGDRVEQSSSLLQVLLLAGLSGVTRLELPLLGRLFSLVAGAVAVLLTYGLARRIHARAALPAALVAATSTGLVYWSVGGLETTLVPVCALALAWTYDRFADPAVPPSFARWLVAFLVTATFLMVRPEMPFVLLALFFVWFLASWWLQRARLSRIAMLASMAAASTAAMFVWRRVYFDRWWPQPVTAKSGDLSWERIQIGLGYLHHHLLRDPFLWIVTLAALAALIWLLVRHRREFLGRSDLLLASAFAGAQIGFVTLSGGDWMEGARFVAPIAPVAALWVGRAWVDLPGRFWRGVGLSALVAVQLAALGRFAARESTGMPLWDAGHRTGLAEDRAAGYSWFERANRVHLREMPAIEYLDRVLERLAPRVPDQVSVLSSQMGMIAYHVALRHYPHVRTLDLYGLTDREFSECPNLANVPKTRWGLGFSPEMYFQYATFLEQECGIRKPDVVFNLFYHPEQVATVDRSGYTVLYVQTGFVETSAPGFPGAAVNASQFIAVRDEWRSALSDLESVRLDFAVLQGRAEP